METPTSTVALTAALHSGTLSPYAYLDQLAVQFARREDEVRAFVPEPDRFARLRREVEELLARFPKPETRPPLFALPVGVKDIFHVAGFETRAGSSVPPMELAGREAEVVRILKENGALVLGKTVTTEFAYFGPGPTRNPHKLSHTPGGSSSGSAAAVAAGLAPLTLGTQTIGSINRPAAFCGVVGYKPSYDRISRAGVIPLSPSLDHVGLFASDVGGVALAAGLLAEAWQPVHPRRQPVLGVPEGPYLAHAESDGLRHFRRTCEQLVEAGFELKQVAAFSDYPDVVARHNLLMAAEAAEVHGAWYKKYAERYHPKTIELLQRGQAAEAADVAAARAGRLRLREELTELMDNHQIDLWITPAARGAAPAGLESTGDPIMNLPWSHSGLPSLTLPAGVRDDGLPLGLQVAARWYQDETLLAWAEIALAPALVGSREIAT